ncbi:MAG: cyclic nucleotide-binding domain-containing protein [Acidobacteriota bacterium]
MQRKVVLKKDAILWEAGESARNIGILEAGKLGVKTETRLIGVIWPDMIFGESALMGLEGTMPKRTATVFAMEDDTKVTEYPASLIRQTFDSGRDVIAASLLRTLVGQISRNCLLLVAGAKDRPVVTVPLKGMMQGVVSTAEQLKEIKAWDEFFFTFRFLSALRDFTAQLQNELFMHTSDRADAILKASESIRSLFKEQTELLPFLDNFLKAEQDKEDWLEKAY